MVNAEGLLKNIYRAEARCISAFWGTCSLVCELRDLSSAAEIESDTCGCWVVQHKGIPVLGILSCYSMWRIFPRQVEEVVCPYFTAIRAMGRKVRFSTLIFVSCDASLVSSIYVDSVEYGTRLSESGINFVASYDSTGEYSFQVGELVHRIQSPPVDKEFGFNL